MNDLNAVRDAQSEQDPRKLLELALKQAESNPEEMRRDIRLLDPTAVDTKRAITFKLGGAEFKPHVAYPIYAADYIRGYREPRLEIEWDDVSLLAHVAFSFKERLDEEAPDALDLLKQFMPDDTVYNDRPRWDKEVTAAREEVLALLNGPELEQADIQKPKEEEGEAASEAKADSEKKTVSQLLSIVPLRFGKATAYLRRVFMFAWFYIEGAQTPDEDDETWAVYVAVDRDTRAFRGYASVYSFLYYATAEQFQAEGAATRLQRKRVAHFLVLPPFRQQGVGRTLYLALLHTFVADPSVKEIEVEDASEAFDVLRDRAQLAWLQADPRGLALLEAYADEPQRAVAEFSATFKMEAVQFQRAAEMWAYTEAGHRESRAVKRMIKQRLYKHNYEDLRDLDPATQREMLQRVYESALYQHRVVLHLEEPEDDEDDEDGEDDDIDELGPAEMLLAQLTQDSMGAKRRRTD